MGERHRNRFSRAVITGFLLPLSAALLLNAGCAAPAAAGAKAPGDVPAGLETIPDDLLVCTGPAFQPLRWEPESIRDRFGLLNSPGREMGMDQLGEGASTTVPSILPTAYSKTPAQAARQSMRKSLLERAKRESFARLRSLLRGPMVGWKNLVVLERFEPSSRYRDHSGEEFRYGFVVLAELPTGYLAATDLSRKPLSLGRAEVLRQPHGRVLFFEPDAAAAEFFLHSLRSTKLPAAVLAEEDYAAELPAIILHVATAERGVVWRCAMSNEWIWELVQHQSFATEEETLFTCRPDPTAKPLRTPDGPVLAFNESRSYDFFRLSMRYAGVIAQFWHGLFDPLDHYRRGSLERDYERGSLEEDVWHIDIGSAGNLGGRFVGEGDGEGEFWKAAMALLDAADIADFRELLQSEKTENRALAMFCLVQKDTAGRVEMLKSRLGRKDKLDICACGCITEGLENEGELAWHFLHDFSYLYCHDAGPLAKLDDLVAIDMQILARDGSVAQEDATQFMRGLIATAAIRVTLDGMRSSCTDVAPVDIIRAVGRLHLGELAKAGIWDGWGTDAKLNTRVREFLIAVLKDNRLLLDCHLAAASALTRDPHTDSVAALKAAEKELNRLTAGEELGSRFLREILFQKDYQNRLMAHANELKVESGRPALEETVDNGKVRTALANILIGEPMALAGVLAVAPKPWDLCSPDGPDAEMNRKIIQTLETIEGKLKDCDQQWNTYNNSALLLDKYCNPPLPQGGGLGIGIFATGIFGYDPEKPGDEANRWNALTEPLRRKVEEYMKSHNSKLATTQPKDEDE